MVIAKLYDESWNNYDELDPFTCHDHRSIMSTRGLASLYPRRITHDILFAYKVFNSLIERPRIIENLSMFLLEIYDTTISFGCILAMHDMSFKYVTDFNYNTLNINNTYPPPSMYFLKFPEQLKPFTASHLDSRLNYNLQCVIYQCII